MLPVFQGVCVVCISGSLCCPCFRESVWSVLTGRGQETPLPSILLHDVREIETWILRLLSAPVPVPGKTRVEVSSIQIRLLGEASLGESGLLCSHSELFLCPHSEFPCCKAQNSKASQLGRDPRERAYKAV